MTGLDPQTVIAIVALLTGLGFIFGLLLGPVKRDIARLEKGQDKILAKLDKLSKKDS